jgi:hypothetical protein
LCALLSLPYSCATCDQNFVRARCSNLWKFLTNGKRSQKEKQWYSSRSLDHLKGVECNPSPLGHHNVEVGKCYLAKPRDKNHVSLVLLFCDCFICKSSPQNNLVKGVFGLTFGFGFCLLKAKSQTKGLDQGSSFF